MKIRQKDDGVLLPGRGADEPEFAPPSNDRIAAARALAAAAGAPLPPVRPSREQKTEQSHFDAIQQHRDRRNGQAREMSGRPVPGPQQHLNPETDEDEMEEAAVAHSQTYIPPVRPSTPLKDKLTSSTAGRPLSVTPKVEVASQLGARWIRQEFPSHSLSYGETPYCCPLTIAVMAKLSAASKNNSFTMFLDALDHCINIDIRRLTPPDLTFFMYWLRLESFPRLTLNFPWTSKYGDQLVAKYNRSDLKITEIEMTQEEYEGWLAKGLCLPTVRDMELLEDKGLSDEDRFRLELAQYIQGDTEFDPKTYIQSKLDKLDEMGPDAYLDIQEFASKIQHGVIETLEVVNTKFKPQTAIAHFEKTADDLLEVIKIADKNSEVEGHEGALISLGAKIKDLRDEAAAMRTKLEKGEPIQPEKEVIAISINAMTFFPSLRQSDADGYEV